MMTKNKYYVYEHWRPDKDICFWVGKGTGDRAYRFRRNQSYNFIVAELAKLGMCVEVRLVASSLLEVEAFRIEEERIAFWKSIPIELVNRSNGGRGGRGKGVTLETRMKLRLANLGKKHSSKTRSKMSATHTLRSRMGKAPKGRPAGFKHSPETIEKMRLSGLGKKISTKTRKKIKLQLKY